MSYRARGGVDSAIVGADGNARLDVHLLDGRSEDELIYLQARHPRFTTRLIRVSPRADQTTWLGDILLLPGGSIEGRLIGADVGDAEVKVYARPETRFGRRWAWWGYRDIVRSYDDGRFWIDGLEPGEYSVVAITKNAFTGSRANVEVVAGESTQLSPLSIAVREPTDTVEGRVLSAGGEPILDAQVQWISLGKQKQGIRASWRDLKLDEDGSFVVELLEQNAIRIAAWIPGRTGRVEQKEIAPGSRDVLLTLPFERSLEVRLRDREEIPIAGAYVRVYLVDEEKLPTVKGRHHAAERAKLEYDDFITDEKGEVRIPEPGQLYFLQVTGDYLGFSDNYQPGQTKRIEMRGYAESFYRRGSKPVVSADEKPKGIRGRVLLDGRPVEGVKVSVHNASPPGFYKDAELPTPGGYSSMQPKIYDVDETDTGGVTQAAVRPFAVFARGAETDEYSTTATGEFFCPAAKDFGSKEWVVLRADRKGYASHLAGPFDAAALDVDDFVLELQATGSIEGLVHLSQGADTTGLAVGVSRGDGICRTSSVAPDGKFRISGLPAGEYQVRLCSKFYSREFEISAEVGNPLLPRKRIEWDCLVQSGAKTWFELDLSSKCELRGTVEVEGRISEGWRVRALPRSGNASREANAIAETTISSGGTFSLEFVDATSVWIELSSGDGFLSWSPFDLSHGLNDVEISLETGHLTWESELSDHLIARWGSKDGTHGECSMSFGFNAVSNDFGSVPAGPVQILRMSLSFVNIGCSMGGRANEFRPVRTPPPAITEYENNGRVVRLNNYGGETLIAELELLAGELRIANALLDGVEDDAPVSPTEVVIFGD
ncbi:MAG: hypothetical protein ACI87A_002899 [Planctomycetota bacterium]